MSPASLVIGVLGVGALGLCATIVVRHSTLEWIPSGASGEAPPTRIAEATRRLSATLAAGFVAGLLIAGVGGCFFMRVVGADSLARPLDLLAPESIDFEILGPLWLAVGFAVGLIMLLGTATCVLADRWVQQ